jgi:hypothetical protein
MLTFRPTTEGHDLHVEVHGSDIVVTLPSTTFKVIFQRFPIAPQLMANWHVPRGKAVSEARRRQFLASAWKVASDKARELRWIV